MAELFQRDKSTISRHIKNIFAEGELKPDSTVAKSATVQREGSRTVERQIDYYNLDVIISVGYRVKSLRGTQFRIWASNVLKEYMKKGFALDDERLKNLGGGNYFDELLARIRDIRSSEKVFWRKVLEIYATSIDYNPKAESSIAFFKQVQNKMHWAAHKHTAAEVIYERADADKENMGLTSWSGDVVRRTDVEVAKNYLGEQEIDALNKIVTAYLDIAEVHALNQEPMYMKNWLETIDDYLKMTRRDILTTKGKVSHKQALYMKNPTKELLERQILMTVGIPELRDRYELDTKCNLSMQEYVSHTQIYFDSIIRDKCYQILDYLYSIAKNDAENTSNYLQIKKMDMREADETKIAENIIMLEPKITGEAQKVVQRHEESNEPQQRLNAAIKKRNDNMISGQIDLASTIDAIEIILELMEVTDIAFQYENTLIILIASAINHPELKNEEREKFCDIWLSGIEKIVC